MLVLPLALRVVLGVTRRSRIIAMAAYWALVYDSYLLEERTQTDKQFRYAVFILFYFFVLHVYWLHIFQDTVTIVR